MKLLLQSGADVGIRDKSNKIPLDIALESGKRDIAVFLSRHVGNLGSSTQLGDATLSDSSEAVKEAVSQNGLTDIHHSHDDSPTSDEGGSSLHTALANRGVDAVRRLLDRGADVNERGEIFWTLLHVASKDGKLEVAKALIEYGADVNPRDITGWTPLHVAARYGHTDVARLLLDNGTDVKATQQDYHTPLHLAAKNGYPEIVELLVERGANVQAKNVYDRTASHEASRSGYRKIAQFLSELA